MLAALGCALVLAGCTGDDGWDAAAPPPPPAPAELTAEWSIPGLQANPEGTGPHHWVTHGVRRSGISRATTYDSLGLLLVDTRTGRTRRTEVPDDEWPCQLPRSISDSGVTPVLGWSMRGQMAVDCADLRVLDATTGKTLWSKERLGLDRLSDQRAVVADDRVVAVVDHRGRAACFGARDGERVSRADPSCVGLREQVTYVDLPRLVDPDGQPVPLPAPESYALPAEIGRTDDVVLLRAEGPRDEATGTSTTIVRAHDRRTGETLWQDDDLTPDPHAGDTWSRDEDYGIAPSGVFRVSYEHVDDAEKQHLTPMVVTAVDPRTGEDLHPVARVEGAWFNHQFGDMTVALTEQELLLRSTISGFRLPTW